MQKRRFLHILLHGMFLVIVIQLLTAHPTLAQTGYLDIITDVDDVSIFVNGSPVGKAPITGLALPAGTATIVARRKDGASSTQTVRILSNDVVRLMMPLKGVPGGTTENLIMATPDQGAVLIINKLGNEGVYVDGTPRGAGSLKIANISTGLHTLKVGQYEQQFKIYKDYLLEIEVSASGISIRNDFEETEERRKEMARLAMIAREKEAAAKLERRRDRIQELARALRSQLENERFRLDAVPSLSSQAVRIHGLLIALGMKNYYGNEPWRKISNSPSGQLTILKMVVWRWCRKVSMGDMGNIAEYLSAVLELGSDVEVDVPDPNISANGTCPDGLFQISLFSDPPWRQ